MHVNVRARLDACGYRVLFTGVENQICNVVMVCWCELPVSVLVEGVRTYLPGTHTHTHINTDTETNKQTNTQTRGKAYIHSYTRTYITTNKCRHFHT